RFARRVRLARTVRDHVAPGAVAFARGQPAARADADRERAGRAPVAAPGRAGGRVGGRLRARAGRIGDERTGASRVDARQARRRVAVTSAVGVAIQLAARPLDLSVATFGTATT